MESQLPAEEDWCRLQNNMGEYYNINSLNIIFGKSFPSQIPLYDTPDLRAYPNLIIMQHLDPQDYLIICFCVEVSFI